MWNSSSDFLILCFIFSLVKVEFINSTKQERKLRAEVNKVGANKDVVDAALIYESGADTHMDYVIVITTLIKIRMERALARETLSREEILKRIDLQWPEEEKIALADFVVHNDGTEKELKVTLSDIYNDLV